MLKKPTKAGNPKYDSFLWVAGELRFKLQTKKFVAVVLKYGPTNPQSFTCTAKHVPVYLFC